jgi:peptide/nickel transport system substrate-binding protein
MYEGLIQFDQFTDSQPMLATDWSTNDDFTVWTFNLRRGVPFHDGWGEVTAKDVVHTMRQERRLDHFDSRGAIWRELIDRVEMPAGPTAIR